MYRYREPAICRHIKAMGKLEPQFCNHYSYKFNFVNYLSVLGFLPRRRGKESVELPTLRVGKSHMPVSNHNKAVC